MPRHQRLYRHRNNANPIARRCGNGSHRKVSKGIVIPSKVAHGTLSRAEPVILRRIVPHVARIRMKVVAREIREAAKDIRVGRDIRDAVADRGIHRHAVHVTAAKKIRARLHRMNIDLHADPTPGRVGPVVRAVVRVGEVLPVRAAMVDSGSVADRRNRSGNL